MAESTLSLDFWTMVERVGDYLGYGSSPAGENFARVRRCIEDGYRQFLFPTGRQWSFLRPQSTLAFRTSYKETGTTSTCSIATVTVTDTAAHFLSYGVETGDSFVVSAGTATAGTYEVSSVTSETVLVLTATAGTGTATYTVGDAAWQYALPDDFGGLIESFRWPKNTGYERMTSVSVERILALRAGSDTTGEPYYYAMRPLPFVTGTGQRWQALFYPTPSNARTMYYRPRLMPSKWANARISQSVTVGETPWTVLTGAGSYTTAAVVAGDRINLTGTGGPTAGLYTVSTKDSATQLTMTAGAAAPGTMNAEVIPATLYHYGGLLHSQTLLTSCLERAEVTVNDGGDGRYAKAWPVELARSIALDCENDATVLGYNGDRSDFGGDSVGGLVSSLTVNGVTVFSN